MGIGLRRRNQSPMKVHQLRSSVKELLTIFFDYNGEVHREFLPEGRTVHKVYYFASIA